MARKQKAKERLCRRCGGSLDRPAPAARYCTQCMDVGQDEQRARARQAYRERGGQEKTGLLHQAEGEFKEPMHKHMHGPLLFSEARQEWAWMLVRAYLRNQGLVVA